MTATTLDAAVVYIRRDWRVIPVPYRKKGPELKDWPSLRISEADAPRYFNGAKQNIGVVLGPCSGNLCDVDLDCDEAIAAAVLLPLTVSVPTILLRSYMGQATGFERYDGRSKDWIPTKAPIDVAELILSRAGHWPFPEIRGVLAAPSMRRLNPAPARV